MSRSISRSTICQVPGAEAAAVVFFGYSEFAVAGIDSLTEAGARIAAVVLPSNRTGPDIDIVRDAGASRGLAVWTQPRRSEIAPFIAKLRAASPDVVVVWSYSMILPVDVLQVPRFGGVNVHSGLLPQYRGGHVMQWALVNGEAETGVTLHYMDAGVDTGPVIAQERFVIEADDDAVAVKKKLKRAGSALLKQWWPRIAAGTAPRQVQDESQARHWRMRTSEDGLIDWSKQASEVERLVRALACNEPGAYIDAGRQKVSIRRVRLLDSADPQARPGHIVHADAQGIRIAALGGDILIVEATVDGRPVSAAEFVELTRLKTHA